MHVNTTAQYALRVMMRLVALPPGTRVRARDLSKATGVPTAYLSKVMRRLARRRLLHAVKGHGGGYRLARPAGTIRLSDILAAAGGTLERDLCVFGDGRCDAADPCPLHDSWSELNDAFHSWSRRTTLRAIGSSSRPRRRAGRLTGSRRRL